MKIITYLLLAAMLLQFSACNKTPTTDETTSTKDTTAADNGRVQHKLSEDLDFGGATFGAAFFDNASGTADLHFADESSTEVMTAAVYRRTMKTEDFLGVDIQHTTEIEMDEYKALYQAGDDLYQQLYTAFPLEFVVNGYMYNLDTLPHVDFTAEWWNYEQMDVLALTDNHYFAVSDFMITSPSAILFNRNMVTDNNLENPYDLVLNGTWTLDKYIEMSTAVMQDVDTDGSYTGEDDIIGSLTGGAYAIPFFAGANQFISAKNEEGVLELVLNTEKTLDLVDKLHSFAQTKGGNVDLETTTKSYADGNVLFYPNTVQHIANTTNYDFDTGVVPYPKYNAEQENYVSYDWSVVMGVSATTKNPEMVGAVLEYLSWDSKNEVFPTYYDVLLKTRYSQDMETREMMNILFDTIAYEVGGVYFNMSPGFCELWYTPAQVLCWGLSNFSAFFRPYKGAANQTIQQFYDAMAVIEETAVEEESAA